MADEETGWYYLQSRYYNPEVGRFISADVYLSTGQGVLGHNAYAYCLNNPVNRFDSDGYISLKGLLEFLRQLCEGIGGPRWNLPSSSSSPLSNSSSAVVAQGQQAYGPDVSVDESSRSNHRNEMRNSRSLIAEESDGVCFIAGTLILTEKDEVQIEDIETGDYVYATDPESGESSYKRVVQTFERETYEIVKVTYGGETITTTPTHPFYVPEKGWTEAIKLRAGDILVKNNGEYVVVEKVQHEILEAPITVYNFEVEDYHTYYVAASADSDLFVLVHNRCGTSYELSDNQLQNFGHKGKTSGYRVTHGSHENAMDFVLTQTNGLIEYSPGKYVGYNSRGVEFRIYPRSGYTYTSIRINGVSGLKGIKFIWD